ncbi:acetylxylan esterase [Haliscomenobacter sp.]|uniref:glucuronyl esterase domain-containing protein n=1 Tax=Haliscomenobacter sp. TaxID=2717303 RepID=UPI003593636F
MKHKTWFALVFLLACLNGSGQSKVEKKDLMLPEVLTSNQGKRIRNAKMWIKKRRPEILQLFEDNLYGQVPKEVDSIRFNLKKEEHMAMNGKAKLKEIQIDVYRNKQSVTINLLLFIPANTSKPAPVFLLINHRGKDNTDPTRTLKSEFWPAEEVIARGYAIAAFHVSDVAIDHKETYHEGVLRLYPEQMTMGNGMKTIGAWAWGASRVMDYFEKDRDIDRSKVAVVGHSRGGKAALWAGAQDQRFATVISNDAGEAGAALSRHLIGETILDINTNFPHWFCDNYKKFNSNINALPIDQHMLIALMAPRAVYVASASEDKWADPVGEFLSLKYAEPVFNLFNLKPLPAPTQPAVNVPVKSSNLGYHLRTGIHNLTLYDWERFMDFISVPVK